MRTKQRHPRSQHAGNDTHACVMPCLGSCGRSSPAKKSVCACVVHEAKATFACVTTSIVLTFSHLFDAVEEILLLVLLVHVEWTHLEDVQAAVARERPRALLEAHDAILSSRPKLRACLVDVCQVDRLTLAENERVSTVRLASDEQLLGILDDNINTLCWYVTYRNIVRLTLF